MFELSIIVYAKHKIRFEKPTVRILKTKDFIMLNICDRCRLATGCTKLISAAGGALQ